MVTNTRKAEELALGLTQLSASTPSARLAGLHYTCDTEPGYHRLRRGVGFVYHNGSKRLVRAERLLERFVTLRIPPAWTDVWICADELGHLQATGRDARGRKQYRYHDRWRTTRDRLKFTRMIRFAEALPRIRRRIARDLRRPGLDRQKVLAAMARLLDQAQLRVGGEEYARQNGSFGLATIKSRHAKVNGSEMKIAFRGKSGKMREVRLEDALLARIVRKCQELPGQDLFQYLDEEGRVCDVRSQDVNEYVRTASGGDFTAKDFRTWAATILALTCLTSAKLPDSQSGRKQTIAEALRTVATQLGNTPAVCRKSYVHPGVLEAFQAGRLRPSRVRKRIRGLAQAEVTGLATLRQLSRQTKREG
jgi:DNA topoisomerase-1